MAWLLWAIIGLGLGFTAGYWFCYWDFLRLARRLKMANDSKAKRKRRNHKREGATAIGFSHDGDEEGMVAM